MRRSFADWLAPRVDRSGGPEACWPRIGGIGIRLNRGQKRVHVAVWEAEHGAKPLGARLLRQCANTACVNPQHFELQRSEHADDPFVVAFKAAKKLRGISIRGQQRHHPVLA